MSDLDKETIEAITAGARMALATEDNVDSFLDDVFSQLGEPGQSAKALSEIDIKPKSGDI